MNMKVVYWPIGEHRGAEFKTVKTFQQLWKLIRTLEPDAYERGYIREISANEDDNGNPYLVLSWVEVEEPTQP